MLLRETGGTLPERSGLVDLILYFIHDGVDAAANLLFMHYFLNWCEAK